MVSDGTSTAPPVSSSQSVGRRKVAAFLALAFGLSWTTALVLYLSGVEFGTLVWTVLLVAGFMWAPAIAAIAVQWHWDGSIRAGCRLARGRLQWVALAWIAPVALVALTIGVGTLLPGISFTTDYGAYLLEVGLTQEQVDQAVAQLDALPVPPAVLFAVQGLAAGLTINALAALGEELGWRGLLLSELSPLGFWKLSLLTGAIWGVWHAPIIVQGYNFPDAPLAGVFVMTGATIAVSPVYTYLTVRADTVLAATFFHGTFNGLGGLSLIYLTGAGNLLVAPVGAAGIGAALLATGLCVVHDRFVADDRITVGAPLER
jgi:membrane protease YdiL (CAAX protease family)